MIIGPGFTRPTLGDLVPELCPDLAHRFTARGVCLDCRRTVPELAAMGRATVLPCADTGIHVVVGPVCLECQAPIGDELDAQAGEVAAA